MKEFMIKMVISDTFNSSLAYGRFWLCSSLDAQIAQFEHFADFVEKLGLVVDLIDAVIQNLLF